jgi:hypothetical protein
MKRFWDKVDITNKCWNWIGYKNRAGYGMLGIGYQRPYVHRLSWEIHFGPIPAGKQVCHHCDNPACIRPDHLFLGTARDNLLDAIEKGRHHPPPAEGEQNGRARLTENIVRDIRQRVTDSGAALAREFMVTRQTIHAIRKGKLWSHI